MDHPEYPDRPEKGIVYDVSGPTEKKLEEYGLTPKELEGRKND